MRECTNGRKCVHPDGPNLPESEYYKYDYKEVPTCKECCKAYSKRYSLLEFEDVITRVKKIQKSRRAGRLWRMVKEREISKDEFLAVMKSVDFV